MTVLVTGGAGYVGSHTVRLLREQGHDVVIFDSLELGHRSAVAGVPLIKGDIADRATVRRAIEQYKVDSVLHFAAYKSPAESMANPGRYFTNNAGKSANFIVTLHESGVDRIVFSSSCAVYGTPATVPVSEDASIQPESPYGESKAMTERVLSWFGRCVDFRSVSLRYFNAAGAWLDGSIGEDWTVTTNLIPLVMKAVLGRSGPIQVFGTDYQTVDGSAIRDYVHVIDLADAHIRALDYLNLGGDSTAVNLGRGVGSSVLEVLAATERILGRSVPHQLTSRRPGDPVALFADAERARLLLDWRPQLGLTEILESAWAWHSTHLDGYAR